MARRKPRPRSALENPPPSELVVLDFAWGAIYTGTRIQIIAAGLARLEDWPTFGKDQLTYVGPCELGGKNRSLTIERDYCPTDIEPGDVWVHYLDSERDPGPRI